MQTPPPARHAQTAAPTPIQTYTVRRETADGPTSTVFRRMPTAQVPDCRRCVTCNAIAGPDGQSMCAQEVSGDVRGNAAPELRTNPGTHLRIIA